MKNTSGATSSSAPNSVRPAIVAALNCPEEGSRSVPVSNRSGTTSGAGCCRGTPRGVSLGLNRSAGIVVVVAVAHPVPRTAPEFHVVEDRAGQRHVDVAQLLHRV